jgi:hypothetical protein
MRLARTHAATKQDRKTRAALVPTAEEKIALYDTMFAYAGTYSVEADRVIHNLDMSWNKAWDGTQQVRFTLTYRSAPAKNPLDGKDCVHTVKFQKVGQPFA